MQFEAKKRMKMFKSGKNWCVGATVFIAMLTMAVVHNNHEVVADETSVIKTLPMGSYQEQSDGIHFKYLVNGEAIKGLYQSTNGELRYFDLSDGTQIKGQTISIDGKKYFFEKDSGIGHDVTDLSVNSFSIPSWAGSYVATDSWEFQFVLNDSDNHLTGLHQIDNNLQYFDEQSGAQVKGTWKTVDGNTYYFAVGSGNAVTGLQVIDNKTYIFDNDGKLKKGGDKAISFDNKEYYLDSVDGHATLASDDNYSSVDETKNEQDFTSHNRINEVNTNSIDTINNYVTADSWYRPNSILKNGTTWRDSTENDRRPVLMTWWPNDDVKKAYVQFMINQGIVNLTEEVTMNNLTEYTQRIQIAIEKKIALTNDTDWLKSLMITFRKEQNIWNGKSEQYNPSGDAFQGGFLTYSNSDKTSQANSNYRYMNRSPSNQDGNGSLGGSEFLLANDIDNSNPAVQAEQLNWLHFLLHFGSITGNDDDANFDSFRVDAPDNVDADLLQISADYMRYVYSTQKSDAEANKHLSILEDWNNNDSYYVAEKGSDQLTIDKTVYKQLDSVLAQSPDTRQGLDSFLKWSLVDRSVDNTENSAIPNYAFIRAHDAGVQSVLGGIVTELFPGADPSRPTWEQLGPAFKVYNEDMRSANKKYTMYNIPSAYALLLTNKDTIPRVYYGDLYTDDGQYMSEKTPYYDAITQLMKDRTKYVSGGQTMTTGILDANGNKKESNDVLTSVRFGKGLLNATDSDNKRTDGVGVIISNNPNLSLTNGEKVVLHMGAAHRNQKFRASILTDKNGVHVYSSDNDAPTVETDDNGDLNFDSSWVYGVTSVDVSGYLAVWVPVGASDDQDVRSLDSVNNNPSEDGKTLHSNASLDSNLIYEGFSNFQSMPENDEQYANRIISKNVSLFKSWGVTSFQFAPQYRSSTDSSFVDSNIENGYAFTDRYDLGFNNADGSKNPTKYGTDEDLRQAIKALHSLGMQAMADWVPDQIYNLPQQELVTATRTNSYGNLYKNSNFVNLLYVANTKSSGKDFQSIYGGKYLEELKNKYPELFEIKQISTGEVLNTDEKITQWSAKYMNGTNVLQRGAYYVLKNFKYDEYLYINSSNNFSLPNELLGKVSGFVKVDSGVQYIHKDGTLAKSQFIQDDKGNWYYFDENSLMVTGKREINGKVHYFLANGVQLTNHVWIDGAIVYFADTDGVSNVIYTQPNNSDSTDSKVAQNASEDTAEDQAIDKNINEKISTDQNSLNQDQLQESDTKKKLSTETNAQKKAAEEDVITNLEEDIAKTKNQTLSDQDEKNSIETKLNSDKQKEQDDLAALNHDSGSNDSDAGQNQNHTGWNGYLYDSDVNGYRWFVNGELFTGFQYYMGTYYWFQDGQRQDNAWHEAWGLTYYTDGEGRAVQGVQNIDGQELDFGNDGTFYLRSSGYIYDRSSQNGGYRWYENGQLFTGFRYYMGTYYWFVDGVRQNAGWREAWGMKYYTDQDGRAVQGTQVIDGQVYNFGDDGSYYERPVSGYVYDGSDQNGGYRWYENGQLFTGFRYYMGTYYWFVDGVRQNAGWREAWGMKYYTDQDGRAVQGWQNIDGQNYYFGDDGSYYLR